MDAISSHACSETMEPPVEPWRPPFLVETIQVVAQIRDCPPQAILTDRLFTARLERALDDPLALDQSVTGLNRLALNAAELADQLLQAGAPVRAVQKIIECTLQRSLAPLASAKPGLIAEYAATNGHAEELAVEILAALRPTPALLRHLFTRYNWPRLVAEAAVVPGCRYLDTGPYDPDRNAPPVSIPTIYLGHPSTHVNTLPEPAVDLESHRYDVELSLAVVLEAMPAPMSIRLCEPCRHHDAAVDMDLLQLTDVALANSDAYLYAGVRGYALSAGGMYELLRFAAHSGPIGIAQPAGCPHSPKEAAVLDNPMRVTSASVAESLGEFTATWFADNYEEILAVHRRRQNRRLVCLGQRDVAQNLVKRSSNRDVVRALAASGLSCAQLAQLISRPGASVIPWGQLDLFLDRLENLPRRLERGLGPVVRVA